MSWIDPSRGSAAGIPQPPDVSELGSGSPRRARTPAQSGRRSPKWLRFLILAVVIGVVVTVISNRSDPPGSGTQLDDLRVGDCVEVAEGVTHVDVVDCAEPHTAEVYEIATPSRPIQVDNTVSADPEVVRICKTDLSHALQSVLARAEATEHATASYLLSQSGHDRLACIVNSDERTGSYVADAAPPTATTAGA